jgi:hypothetical protein
MARMARTLFMLPLFPGDRTSIHAMKQIPPAAAYNPLHEIDVLADDVRVLSCHRAD